MAKKSMEHKGLLLLFPRDDVTKNTIIMDRVLERTMGEVQRRRRDVGVQVKQT